MPAYKQGKVYMIWSPHTNKVYIGSTTQPLHKRFYDHCHTLYRRTSAHEVIDCGDARIELIEEYPCASKSELNRREGQIIRERACVNKVVAGRTNAEWRQEKKDALAAKAKVYRQEKKEQIAAQRKVYRQEKKEALAAKAKVYRQEKKEQIAAQRRAYRARPGVKERANELARARRQRKKQEQSA